MNRDNGNEVVNKMTNEFTRRHSVSGTGAHRLVCRRTKQMVRWKYTLKTLVYHTKRGRGKRILADTRT